MAQAKSKHPVDFNECIKDSPKFRSSLEDAELDIESLEARLDKIVKQCWTMIDTGNSFSFASSDFALGVKDLANYFTNDLLVSESLNRFANAMSEMLKYFNILMDQAKRSVCNSLYNFIRLDIKKTRESKKLFEKMSDDMDVALTRNSQALRSKPNECEDATNQLIATKSAFAHTSLDYVYQINVLTSKKRFDILDAIMFFMHAQKTFFHQGHDLFSDLETTYMKGIATQIEEMNSTAKQEMKEMEERHTLVQQKDLISLMQTEREIPEKEGYLFKRNSNAFKNYVRRWFCVRQNQLVYRKRSKDTITVIEDDLRLCTIRQPVDMDRRFCFEVLSPTRSHILQADTEDEYLSWISCLNYSISQAYKYTLNEPDSEPPGKSSIDPATKPSNKTSPAPQEKQDRVKIRVEQLLAIPGNNKCCDCGSPDPRWSSINLGITLCIECSGIHRSFGVHVSKVRSITLDSWEPELLNVMVELGNDTINSIYEANVNEDVAEKAKPDSNRNVRERWIRAKYIDKAFTKSLPVANTSNRYKMWTVRKKTRRPSTSTNSKQEITVTESLAQAVGDLPVDQAESISTDILQGCIVFDNKTDTPIIAGLDLDSLDESSQTASTEETTTSWESMTKLNPNFLLYKASSARNLPVMMEAIANRADPNWVNMEEEGMTAIMKAVQNGSLAACELLLLNNAKLDRKDKNGQTPLHHATMFSHTGQVCQFLKRKADQNAKDNQGKTPLMIAVEKANADIVTLLRLAKLNEEMRETEGFYSSSGDETFQDVFQDFTNMASNNPEKLKRI